MVNRSVVVAAVKDVNWLIMLEKDEVELRHFTRN
jgi:hypothetical protein